MKMFRWLAAGVVMALLAALILWSIGSSERASSPARSNSSVADNSSVGPVAPLVARNPEIKASADVVTSSVQNVASKPAETISGSSAFENWARQYVAADASTRASLLAEGEKFAKARHAEMVALIRSNPEQALAEMLPYGLRKQLPESILSLIEQPVSGRGEFRPIYYTPLKGHESEVPPTSYEVVMNKKTYKTFTYGERLSNPAHDTYLHGASIHDDAKNEILLALPPEPARILDADETNDYLKQTQLAADVKCPGSGNPVSKITRPTVAQFGKNYYVFCQLSHANDFNNALKAAHGMVWASTSDPVPQSNVDQLPPGGFSGTQGIKKLLYIRVTFADDPVSPESDDAAQATVKANNRYFNEGSYNTVWWESTVTPVIRLPQRKNFYGEFDGFLLPDAQEGAAQFGYFASDYFMTYVLCTSMPEFKFGGISSGILNGSPGAISHELGHNFGLPHANFWQPEGSVPGPVQPPNPQPPYPIDPDSLLGHNDINAPFILGISGMTAPVLEYGNIHDVMGSGPGHFSAMFKNYMDWLPDRFVKVPTASTTNRIYAFDTPHVSDGRIYALRVRKNFQREYWLSYRQGFPNNPWFSNGLEVDWNFGFANPASVFLTLGNNVLLDTTPDTTYGRQDAALVVGRTLHDPEANLHVTPIAIGGGPDPSDKWIDTVVQIGPFPGNQKPTLTLDASALTVSLNSTVTFSANAQDPDGDQLAYYWDFGDYTFGQNSPAQSKTFTVDGQYVVRCEVSDMKGGVASKFVVVTVGTPTTFTMSGRVLDVDGNPMQGVRVHNSGVKPTEPTPQPDGVSTNAAITNLGTYRYNYTDSDGYYAIGNIPPGTYTARAFLYGYRTEPLDFTDPINLSDGNANNVDFVATPITRVSVTRTRDANEIGASEDDDGIFTLSRTGDTSEDLKVRFNLSGTALIYSNYVLTGVDSVTNVITRTNNGVVRMFTNVVANLIIPAFSSSIDVHVVPFDNTDGDGSKTVILSLLLPTNEVRVTTVLTNILTTNGSVIITNTMFVQRTNQVRIPGWELRPVGDDGTLTWYQTYPTYVLDQSEATVTILDDDAPNLPTVVVTALDSDALESRGDSATLLFTRFGAPIDSDLEVHYALSGEAVNGVDYLPLSGTMTIPAGQTYGLVYVTAINDLFVEGNEDVEVTILPSPDGSYLNSESVATLYIIDDDLPLVNIFAATANVGRSSGGSGRVTISRAGNLDADLVVNYLVSGTAVNGVDYITLPGSVTIPAGQLSADVNVTPIAGSLNPLPRTVTVTISDSTTYNIYSDNSVTVTIFDNTLPTVTISRTTDTINESGGTASFIVTRTGPTTSSLNVFFEVGGSAWEGADYNSLGTNVVIPTGSASVNINVTAINDSARELGDTSGQDSIIVQLRTASTYNVGNPSSSSLRITDDDGSNFPSVGFMLRNSTVPEDVFLTYLYLKVTGNPATNRPIDLDYKVTGGSAVPNVNYFNEFPLTTNIFGQTGTTGHLHLTHYFVPDPAPQFFDYEDNIAVIPVYIFDDGVAGGDKTLTITLFPPSGFQTNTSLATNNGTVYTNVLITHLPTNAFIGPQSSHTITIQDAKTSYVSVLASATHAYEAGPQPVQFIVTRDGATNVPLTVFYAITGTAANGSDFSSLGTKGVGTITIPAGTNSAVVTLYPIDDPTEEYAESVIFTILPKPGYHVGFPDSAEVILVSDDGTIQFSSDSYHVGEDVGTALIPVLRTGGTNLTTTLDYLFVGGTASNGVDYFGTNGTLTFLPGDTVKYVPIPIVNDALVEPDETIFLLLTNLTGGVPLGGQKSAIVTIVNDDTAFDFAAANFRGNENAGVGAVSIRRSGILTNTDTIIFTATNGTAGMADFVFTNISVKFFPGETNHTVNVAILDDVLFEGDETVNLILSNPSPGRQLGSQNTATLTIVDDECKLDFQVVGYSVIEYSNFVTLVVRRTGGTVNPVSVDYASSDGTASNGVDYVAVASTVSFTGDHFEMDTNGSGNVVFVPGESFRTILVPIIDDTLGEGNETFFVTLSNVQALDPSALPGSTLPGPNTVATVTILDNELPGNVDYEFNPGAGANDIVRSVSIAPRGGLVEFLGRVVIGGDFTTVDGIVLNHVARLLPNGVLDTSFNPGAGANSNVLAVAVQTDGRVLVGGEFTLVNNTNRLRLARLNADGKLDLGFDLGPGGVNGLVRAIALQNDGKVIVGGDFSQVSGVARGFVARLNTNGALDMNFVAAVNGSVNALAVQADGKILIGGAFTTVGGASRISLARLNTNGTLDASLAIGTGFNGPLNALALQVDGQILAGGSFSNYNGTTINHLVRLSPAGILDSNFKSGTGPDAPVHSIAFANGGKIVIGGSFSNYNTVPRARFARLTTGGSVDNLFQIGSGANGTVRSVVAQEDTAIVIGGDFTAVNGLPRNHIARIHGDEKLDIVGVEFSSGQYSISEDGGEITITVLRNGNTNRAFNVDFRTSNGTATAPGDYAATNGTLSFGVGELIKTFTVRVFDDAFLEGNETVNLILENASSGIDLSGQSTSLLVIIDTAKSVSFSAGSYSVSESGTNAVITLVRAGSLVGDVTITLSTSNGTAAAGYDYVGFTNLLTFTNGETIKIVPLPFINNDSQPEFTETVVLRLSNGTAFAGDPSTALLSIIDDDPGPGHADGTFDPGIGASRFVRALALQPDGRLLVGGAFTNFASSNLNYVARLGTNGLVDPTFTPGTGPNALVSGIGLSSDGHIALAGAFSNYNGGSFNRLVRLNTNGTADTGFSAAMTFDSALNAAVVQADGRMIVGGAFKSPASGVARVRVNATLDLQFDPGTGADAAVNALALQADGKVLIGGNFTNVAGFARPRVARLATNGTLDSTFAAVTITNGNIFSIALAPNNKVLIGGSFRFINGISRSGVARLNNDGSLDLTFNPGTGANGIVYTLCALTNGSVFIGGDFLTVNGTNRSRYALLQANGAVDPFFDATVGADNTVFASLVTPDQKIIIGGDFTTVAGAPRRGVARLNVSEQELIRILRVGVIANSALLNINSIPGRAYVLEGSTNLSYWFTLSTNLATGATLDFNDAGVSSNSLRFYRARRYAP